MATGDYRKFRQAFKQGLDARRYPIEYLDKLMESGAAQLLCTERAAIVFEIRTYPSGARELHGLIAAGDLHEITETLIPEAERWANATGCIGAVIESRPGWARMLRDRGYRTHQIAVRKEF
jgi:hypothetical protein